MLLVFIDFCRLCLHSESSIGNQVISKDLKEGAWCWAGLLAKDMEVGEKGQTIVVLDKRA